MNPGVKTHGMKADPLRYPWFKMNAFCLVVREIYSLRETLTKNLEVNSTSVTKSNDRTYEPMESRKLHTLGINAGL